MLSDTPLMLLTIHLKSSALLSLFVVAVAGCTESSDFQTNPKGTRTAKASAAEGAQSSGSSSAATEQGAQPSQPAPEGVAPEGVAPEVFACQTQLLQSKTLQIAFPETKGRCVWDIGEQEGGSMMGYMRQKVSLPVDSAWVVCSMAIESDKADLYYDDYIALQFNQRVLLGTTGIIDLLEKDSRGLPVFDWSRLQRKLPSGSTTCLSGSTRCALPGTQQNGALAIEFDALTNQKLMSHALGLGLYEFEVIATGDNDPAIDCAHTGIPLDVSIQYYVK